MGLFRRNPAAVGDSPWPSERRTSGKTWDEVYDVIDDDGDDDDEWEEGDEEWVPDPPLPPEVRLRRAWIGFGAALALPCIAAGVAAAVPSDLFRTIVACSILFIGLPLILVAWVDVARALSEVPAQNAAGRWLRVVTRGPQALFGLVTLLIGLVIIAWVLYNSFVERQPQYRGGFLTFGVSTLFVAMGWSWLREAFSRAEPDIERDAA